MFVDYSEGSKNGKFDVCNKFVIILKLCAFDGAKDGKCEVLAMAV